MTRAASVSVVVALLAAGAANLAYLALDGPGGSGVAEGPAQVLATGLAAAAALAAGWLAAGLLPRLLLVLTAALLLLVGGVGPVLAVGSPILLALLTALARDVALVTADLPEVRVRLLVFAAVGLGGPPVVALAHLHL